MKEPCAYCGGPLLGKGVERDDGKRAHAICHAQGGADPDMNPKFERELGR